MSIVTGLLIGLFALAAVFLVVIILFQDDGADGTSMIFGSAASQQYGARKGNIVTRTTSILALLFAGIALLLAFIFRSEDSEIAIQGQSDIENSNWWEESFSSDAEDAAVLTEEDLSFERGLAEPDTSTGENSADIPLDNESEAEVADTESPE